MHPQRTSQSYCRHQLDPRYLPKMLAGRVLPPILQAPPPHSSVPPVATFFNIPRRYVRSNMQVGDNASLHSPMEDMESPRSLRKSSRIHELRSFAPTSPVQHAKEAQLPSPASSSPRSSKKRIASFDIEANGAMAMESDSSTDHRVPASASSTGSGELSGHVCLCQPEPKIPRPRNGKSDSFFSLSPVFVSGGYWPGKNVRDKGRRLCLRPHT